MGLPIASANSTMRYRNWVRLPLLSGPLSILIWSLETSAFSCSSHRFHLASRVSTIDIIGDRVYLLYANLCDLTRQTARVSSSDRTNTRRVCACAAGLCCGLCCTLSARQDLGRQGAPPPEWWRRQRRFVTDGRQAALHPHLPEDQSTANHARLTI